MNFYPDMYMLEELALVALPALTSAVPSSLLGIASYVLTSMALHTLATRRGIGNAWLSWVPVLNVWIIGSLSDQYRYVVKGQYKAKRRTLLILNLLCAVITVAIAAVAIVMAVDLAGSAVYGVYGNNLARMVMGPVFGIVGLCLPLAGMAIASAVIRYMALYDIYTSMDPGNNVLYLVLSILFGVTEPFFLFFNRNKDDGMPPRKQEPDPEHSWQPQTPASEAWEEHKDYL